MKLLLASGNQNKVAELRAMLKDTSWQVTSLREYPEIVMPPEDADSFLGNAVVKARTGAVATGLWTLADDSGLEVDWLAGRPGVYSARYAGPEKDDQANNQKLLREMLNCPDNQRQARFVSVVALVSPDGEVYSAEGICPGTIGKVEIGEYGFGYDPLFWVDGLKKTMSQLTMAEKNKISHRAKAFAGIQKILHELEQAD